MDLTATEIAHRLHCPAANVNLHWPLIEQCLSALGIGDDPVLIAAAATTAVETAWTFKPIHEYGSDQLHEKEYAGRLGNVHVGDGAKYAGRGFIQITGEVNYAHYGKLCGVDLVANPDEALEPNCAAVILAAFFNERNVAGPARVGDWEKVRRLVNGGLNGYEDFLKCVKALQGGD